MATENVTKEQFDALKEDIASFRDDFKNLLSAVSESGKAKGHEAMDKLHDTYDHAREQGVQAGKQCYDTMAEHPMVTMAAAFGAGLVLGKLLSDKR
ncbi:MAG: YqjD family protein [Candidatus Sumerlaeia bacterium]